MANEIKDKFSSTSGATALTITLGSLASATGRGSTSVDNSSVAYQDLVVYVKITNGASWTAYSSVEVYLIRSDHASSSEHFDDGFGGTDGAFTPKNATLIGTLRNDSSVTTDEVIQGSFLAHRPGPEWAIGIYNNTGAALNSTDGNHYVKYIGLNPEVQ